MAKEDDVPDYTDKSWDELNKIHEAVMKAREQKAVDHQNELIREYQELREKMVKAGVASDEALPRFKARGWSRKTTH